MYYAKHYLSLTKQNKNFSQKKRLWRIIMRINHKQRKTGTMRVWSLNRSLICSSVAILAVLFFAACTSDNNSNDPKPGEELKSNKQRVLNPDVPSSDILELSEGNTEFAFDLYQELTQTGDNNFFFSPLSISIALAMTYAGSLGETKSQMADVLHFTLEDSKLHTTFNALDLALESRGQDAQGADGDPFRLHVVNALWGQTGYPFKSDFLDLLALNYGAGMTLLDFTTAAEPARIMINDWVAQQTEDRILDLIPEGAITALTRLVLTNAVYFNAAWLHPFEEENTAPAEFDTAEGPVTVDMMQQTEFFPYAEVEGCQAVELPYDGEELSMVILMPNEESFDAFESSLSEDKIAQIMGELDYQDVTLTMPKFSFTSDFLLGKVLTEMGMSDAFDDALADFNGMAETYELYISKVIHKAFVGVDEAGTEAAAATAVIMEGRGVPEEPVEMRVDRPFIFFIRDIQTQAIVFLGRVLDPTQE